jgi:retinol dehydrogenase-12
MGGWITAILSRFLITPEDGALTQLYLATSSEVEEKDIKGQYYVS